MTSPVFVSAFLNFIEEREQRLQNWGFYDVAFAADELEDLIASDASDALRDGWDEISARGTTLGAVLTEMRRVNLLHLVPDGSGRVRSRFAEGVRLLAHLRQRFSHDDWATAPRLVADLKINLAPRRYPRVGVSADDAWQILAPAATQPQFQSGAFRALAARPSGGSFTFAGFQVRSFDRIFRSYGAEGQSGTVVCASTGAGKTKAFYVPAFTALAAELGRPDDTFTKVVAVYPRNVLLADQLREAISEAAKLKPVLDASGKRAITFGALLGDLPPAGQLDNRESKFLTNWKRASDRGWIIPFLRAPFHPGRGELVWLDQDRRAGRTTLYRADGLDEPPEIPDGVLRLTREDLQANPPDVLFLSLEMLHRELGNPSWARTFGVSAEEKPRLLLFDEVHNYSGLSGAQAPWIIARWRQAARLKNLHVVGLSATLRHAPAHLATIGCLNPERVVECTPTDEELVPEGREYTVLVKGDPASGASLLATSIQTAMLQSRLLTPVHEPLPARSDVDGESVYLRKVFGFADQLDSLNRWLPDLHDAERRGLAQYRSPPAKSGQTLSPATERAMVDDGQIWNLPDRLGHDLAQSARVTRCSSQDPGADTASDIIVATASLEVGFDDPDVGAVIQHKAPRSIASFLQRRGRAGRTRGSRPTTLVILSDAGRDRWLFQNSERLFQPDVEPIKVPVLNPYVQHVQATSFLLDWLGRKVGHPDPVSYLRRPGSFGASGRSRAISWLRRLLELGDDYAAFRRELGWVVRHAQRFRLSGDEEVDRIVDGMLWEAPRPVLRHAVPALLRKLEAEWRMADPSRPREIEDAGASQPLPQFVPSASFADLSAADLVVEFPSTTKDREIRGVSAQLIESCPGRVSKRFSVRRGEVGYWLQGSDILLTAASPVELPARHFFPEGSSIGFDAASAALQPSGIALVARPANVKDSSNASWSWMNSVELIGEGRPLDLFSRFGVGTAFGQPRAFLHGDHDAIITRRRTSDGRFDLLMDRGLERRGVIRLGEAGTDGWREEPVGFEQTADALLLPLSKDHLQAVPALEGAFIGALRQDYFRHLLHASPILRQAASPHTLNTIWQTSLAMLTATASRQNCDLEAAQGLLEGRRLAALGRVMSRMHSASALQDDEDDHDAGGKSRDRVSALWDEAGTASEIKATESALWRAPDAGFHAWLRARHLRTLAEACLEAIHHIAVDIGEGELVADVLDDEDGPRIVISETAPGGIGQIEAFVQSALDDEGAFERALDHALTYCVRQAVSGSLRSIVARAQTPGAITTAFAAVRGARGYQQTRAAQEGLVDALEASGESASRQTSVAVMGRLLGPGSNAATDAWSHLINRLWERWSARLGAPVHPRVFAYQLLERRPIRRRLSTLVEELTGQQPSEAQLFARTQDFLLEGCDDTCPQCLQTTNRFISDISPSRRLSRVWLASAADERPSLTVAPGWLDELISLLAEHDRVEVFAGEADLPAVGRALQTLIAQTFERDYLHVWPMLTGVYRHPGGWRVVFEVRSTGVR
jgi:hypothetical protein